MDNIARNVLEMAAQGRTHAEIEAETGWTRAQIRLALAEPKRAVAQYEAQEIPRKWILARQIHNARPGDCRRCRYRRDGVSVCVTPVCYQALWDNRLRAGKMGTQKQARAARGKEDGYEL